MDQHLNGDLERDHRSKRVFQSGTSGCDLGAGLGPFGILLLLVKKRAGLEADH